MKNLIIIQYNIRSSYPIQRIVIRPTNIDSFLIQAYILYQIFTFYSTGRKFRPYNTAVNLSQTSYI